MNIWLDTTDIKLIQQAQNMGLLYGVTTNPEIIAQSDKTLEQALTDILKIFKGPLAAQVIATNTKDMIKQGKHLHEISDQIIVKVPVSLEGLEAIHTLSKLEIPTMGTVVFYPHQALTAAIAGAQYIAPYVGRIEKMGQDPWTVLNSMQHILYHFDVEILAASLGNLERMQKCAEIGIPHVTIKEQVFHKLTETSPVTQEFVNFFTETWDKANLAFLKCE